MLVDSIHACILDNIFFFTYSLKKILINYKILPKLFKYKEKYKFR